MLKINAEQFVEATQYLLTLRNVAENVAEHQQARQGAVRHLTPSEREATGLDKRLEELRGQCEALDMRLTIKHVNRFLNENPLRPEQIVAYSVEIYQRFRDELAERRFYSLNDKRATFYEEALKGWESVVDRFAACSFDVEESRKCLALERFTAAVFHLMRITETAVLELQAFLGQKDVKAHFGSVLAKLEHLVQKDGYSRVPVSLQVHYQFLEQILTQLHAVKDSWRDKVTHVDERIVPADLFTEEMAMGIHDATLLLMKKLAVGLPKPSAAIV